MVSHPIISESKEKVKIAFKKIIKRPSPQLSLAEFQKFDDARHKLHACVMSKTQALVNSTKNQMHLLDEKMKENKLGKNFNKQELLDDIYRTMADLLNDIKNMMNVFIICINNFDNETRDIVPSPERDIPPIRSEVDEDKIRNIHVIKAISDDLKKMNNCLKNMPNTSPDNTPSYIDVDAHARFYESIQTFVIRCFNENMDDYFSNPIEHPEFHSEFHSEFHPIEKKNMTCNCIEGYANCGCSRKMIRIRMIIHIILLLVILYFGIRYFSNRQ